MQINNENDNIKFQKAVLLGMVKKDDDPTEVEKSLDELSRLLDTAGGFTFARVVQNKATPDPRTMIGSGKVKEVSELCRNNDIKLVVFDDDLSPSQIRNLEDEIGNDVLVLDRSMLILDIFALHAVSGEGKLQVELAQLKYTAPRLIGKGAELSRLGGGIGTRGPGESKLESDKRHMNRRIRALEEELEILEKNRLTMRMKRDKSNIPKIAIVGYTNAGKSTLLNRLTDAGILAEDKLFATLDPTTRKFELPNGESVLLTDTVGFIKKLPHHLVKAFKSTLDEAAYSDIVMIVIDASDDEANAEIEVTEKLLTELNAGGKPTIYVYNKCDKGVSNEIEIKKESTDDIRSCAISALTGEGLDTLLSALEYMVSKKKSTVKFVIPNSEQSALNILYKNASVNDVEYGEENVIVYASVDSRVRGMLRKYDVDYVEDEEE